jgi:hypothetical protein
MATPSNKNKITSTQISDEDLKDRNPKTMTRRITSALRKSFSKTVKRTPTPSSKTYKFDTEEDFKDRTKFLNKAGVGPNNTVFWTIILKIDPGTINPKIKYTNPDLMEVVTRVLRNGKTLNKTYGKKDSVAKTEALHAWQTAATAARIEEKRKNPRIREKIEDDEKTEVDAVFAEIAADVRHKKLEGLFAKLDAKGGRSRRRRRNRLQNKK